MSQIQEGTKTRAGVTRQTTHGLSANPFAAAMHQSDLTELAHLPSLWLTFLILSHAQVGFSRCQDSSQDGIEEKHHD